MLEPVIKGPFTWFCVGRGDGQDMTGEGAPGNDSPFLAEVKVADPASRLGKYEIVGSIGRGGFATVYQARDTVLDRYVALKVLAPHLIWDPEFVARFKQEARIAAHLRHPNIVAIYEIDEVEGQLFIAMELVTAGALQTTMQARGPLPLAEAVELLAPIADALDEAHSQGLVHRDVKPANILLDKTRTGALRPLLTDFGLVKALSQHTELTRSGAILGTVEYMAPEQIDIDRSQEIGPATDIYALSIVVYHMLTGQVPFSGSSAQVMYAHMHKAPPAPADIRADLPAAVSASILTALAKQPGDRFPTATDFIQTLAAASRPVSTTPAAVVPPARTAPPSRPEGAKIQPAVVVAADHKPPPATPPSTPAPTVIPTPSAPVTAAPDAAVALAFASRLAALFRSPSEPLLDDSERGRFIGSFLLLSIIGAALGWPLAAWISGPLTDRTWEAPLAGLVIGVIMAAWQAPKLSHLIPNRALWVAATGVGVMLAFVLLKDINPFLTFLVTVGLLQALTLWRGLHPTWSVAWAPLVAAALLLGMKLAWRAVSDTGYEEVIRFFGHTVGEAMYVGLNNALGWDRMVSLFGYLGWLIRGFIIGAVVGAVQGIYLAFGRGRQR